MSCATVTDLWGHGPVVTHKAIQPPKLTPLYEHGDDNVDVLTIVVFQYQYDWHGEERGHRQVPSDGRAGHWAS